MAARATSAAGLIADLAARGISLRERDGSLVASPADRLAPEDVAILRDRKPELLATLRRPEFAIAADLDHAVSAPGLVAQPDPLLVAAIAAMEPDERDAWAATNLAALPGEKTDPAVFGAWVLAQRVAAAAREQQAVRGERAA